MLPIIWRSVARRHLADILRIIAADSPGAARRMKGLIEGSVVPASEHPYLFRAGRVPGTREIVAHPNYVVVYQVAATGIEVVAVLHTRQHYPHADTPTFVRGDEVGNDLPDHVQVRIKIDTKPSEPVIPQSLLKSGKPSD